MMNLQTRFHELAIEEALGVITPEGLAKLERMDRLLHPSLPSDRWHYAERCLLKKGRFLAWCFKERPHKPKRMQQRAGVQ